MRSRLVIISIAALLATFGLVGCSGESNDTTAASKEIQEFSGKGGNEPSPNLPQPMTAGPGSGGAAAKTGKFRPAGG